MKCKKMLSALLAVVMVFALACTPAFAADQVKADGNAWAGAKAMAAASVGRQALGAGRADTLAEINVDEDIWIGVTNRDALYSEVEIQTRDWSLGSDEVTLTKGKAEAATFGVCSLPLGVTLAAGTNNEFLDNAWVYTDHDGDGIYEERIEKVTWDGDTFVDAEIVPADTAGPLTMSGGVTYGNAFDWACGVNYFTTGMRSSNGYRTLTTDYLVETFGANTIILFTDNEQEYYIGIMLTGEKAQEGVAVSLSEQGIYFSRLGDVISGWAVEPVNAATKANLLTGRVRQDHSYDLTGKITRAQFADTAVQLYMMMSGKDSVEYTANAFSDVSKDNIYYSAIMAARDLGIVNGTSTVNNTFEPNKLVSRQDAALMLSRVYTILGGTIPTGAATTFNDNAKIAPYAMDAVAFMSSKGIINGRTGNNFDPIGNASVEEALKIAVEMLNNLKV